MVDGEIAFRSEELDFAKKIQRSVQAIVANEKSRAALSG